MKSGGRPAEADSPAPRRLLFSLNDLRLVRQVTAQWATRVGLSASRTDDFVIAVQEIAANAVQYGSPAARLLLRVTGGAAAAEIHDDGCWQASPEATPAAGRSGGMGLALARLVCDEVEIRTGSGGTTVLVRMRP
ncbi:MAG TPA: ATP-binding protein [Streptosporangiaceae bacterium]|nr:ATP-binding protein [Streptosporangiaceae bacterium]